MTTEWVYEESAWCKYDDVIFMLEVLMSCCKPAHKRNGAVMYESVEAGKLDSEINSVLILPQHPAATRIQERLETGDKAATLTGISLPVSMA